MDPFFSHLAPALSRFGPWLVFLMTMLETSCFIGLLLPAEATVLLGGFLAAQGYFSVEAVLLAAASGGFVGDQIGYGLGRFGGNHAAGSNGPIGRIWRRHEVRAHSLFRRQSLLAISAARFVSFVRTLMPWLAGMSRMRYQRFVIYDAIGVTAWACASVALGYYGGESIDRITNTFGVLSALVLIALCVVVYRAIKHRRESRRADALADTRLYRVALTGNIGSGKSTVAEIWQRAGAHIIDADVLARAAIAPGTPGIAAVRARFGNDVIEPWGDVNRAALRRKVFDDAEARRDLEQIVHPEVERLRAETEQELARQGVRIMVNVIPLLFEINAQDKFDEVIFVDAPEEAREARITSTRGLTAAEARAMMAAQMAPDDKMDMADHVVDNSGTVEELEERAMQIWRGITERACE